MQTRNQLPLLIIGIGIGAGLMYVLDPIVGRRRRAVMIDKTKSLGNRSVKYLDKRSRDIANRAKGVVAETAGRFTKNETTDQNEQIPDTASM